MADGAFAGPVSPASGWMKLFRSLLRAADPVLAADACRRPRAPRALDAALMQRRRSANEYPSRSERRWCRVTQCPQHHRRGGRLLTAHEYTAPAAIVTAFAWTLGRLGPHVSYGSCLARVVKYLVECQVGKRYLYQVSRASIIPLSKGRTTSGASLDTRERHKSRERHRYSVHGSRPHGSRATGSGPACGPKTTFGTYWTPAETLLRCCPGPDWFHALF